MSALGFLAEALEAQCGADEDWQLRRARPGYIEFLVSRSGRYVVKTMDSRTLEIAEAPKEMVECFVEAALSDLRASLVVINPLTLRRLS